LGRWEVEIDKRTFYYLFKSDNKIGWTDKDKYRAGVSKPLGEGTWKMERDGLKIRWDDADETETWAGISRMSVDLAIRDLAWATRTKVGRLQLRIKEITARAC